jgi:FkbM family methyltransferase
MDRTRFGVKEDWWDEDLRYNYSLNQDSIVFDLGGYHGLFSKQIYNRYKCNIHTFEPIDYLYDICHQELKDLDKVKLYRKVLGDKNDTVNFYVAGDASSIYMAWGQVKNENSYAEMVPIDSYMADENIHEVDLLKMNIEGAEYYLLEYMIDKGILTKFKNIQIQFHENSVDNWRERYNKIIDALNLTHFLTYKFEFKFENWQIKDNL